MEKLYFSTMNHVSFITFFRHPHALNLLEKYVDTK